MKMITENSLKEAISTEPKLVLSSDFTQCEFNSENKTDLDDGTLFLSYIYVSLSVTLSEGVDGGYYAEHFFL
jgi:hypothetical protein